MKQDGERQLFIFVDPARTGEEEFAYYKEVSGRTDREKFSNSLNNCHNDNFDDVNGIHRSIPFHGFFGIGSETVPQSPGETSQKSEVEENCKCDQDGANCDNRDRMRQLAEMEDSVADG